MSHYSKNKKHKTICMICEVGMDGREQEYEENGGMCDDRKYEWNHGKMQLNAPIEMFGSSYNLPQATTNWREIRE